jgi:DNA-binding HxlR family transcriptional regulator
MLRVKLFKMLEKGVKHLYDLATSLRLHFSTVHGVLESFKEAGVVEVEGYGPRGAIYYGLTQLGRRILPLIDWVEAHGLVKPSKLKKLFDEEVVNAALNAGLLETRVEKIKLQRLMLDAPLGISKEGLWMTCNKCGKLIDITSRPDHAICSCGQMYKRPNINWSKVFARAILGALKFGIPSALGGAAVGYFVVEKDRTRGAKIGAKAAGITGGIIGALLEGWRAFEEESHGRDYIPV